MAAAFMAAPVFLFCAYGLEMDTDTQLPSISVSADGAETAGADEGFFSCSRHISITIRDREELFDLKSATDGIVLSAADIHGTGINVSAAGLMTSAWTEKGDEHTAVLTFSADANYEWSISYKNKAGRTAYAGYGSAAAEGSAGSEFRFTVDKTAPEGVVTAGEDCSWSDLRQELTPVTYIDRGVTVSAEDSSDAVSGIKDIEYYRTEGDEVLGVEELKQLFREGSFDGEKCVSESEGQFMVYARICDRAGNAVYVSTDRLITDKSSCSIGMELPPAGRCGFYNKDVSVSVSVREAAVKNVCSGIRRVSGRVLKDGEITQEKMLYRSPDPETESAEKPYEPCRSWSGELQVDALKNDSDNVTVIIEAEDNAGNISEERRQISVCGSRPSVSIMFRDKAGRIIDGQGYYSSDRQALLTVADRDSAFDQDAMLKGISVTASDANGKKKDVDIGSMLSGWTHEKGTHTAVLTFAGDAVYKWTVSYVNKADMEADIIVPDGCETPFSFAVDKTAPDAGYVTVNGTTWSELPSELSFSHFSKNGLQISADGSDAFGPAQLEYCLSDSPDIMSERELDRSAFKTYAGDLDVTAEGRVTVYLRVKDLAGNRSYFSSDGYIVDRTPCRISLVPDDTDADGIWNKDVSVGVHVEDRGCSGIKTVDYRVIKNGEKPLQTQEGSLYAYNVSRPAASAPEQQYDGRIVVDARQNNSCDTTLYVTAADNAGNTYSQLLRLDIDITAPTIEIRYDNNSGYGGSSFFSAPRTAAVSITERSCHFDEAAASAGIKAAAVCGGRNIRDAYRAGSWQTISGSGDPDRDVHMIRLYFEKDAEYILKIDYTDMAGNPCSEKNTCGSEAPFRFTVDRTSPEARVTAEAQDGTGESWDSLRKELSYGFFSRGDIKISCKSSDKTSGVAYVKYYKDVSRTARDSALTAAELDRVRGWKAFQGLTVRADEQCVVYLKIYDRAGNYRYISTDGLTADSCRPAADPLEASSERSDDQPVNGIYSQDVKISVRVRDPARGGAYSGLKKVSYKVYDYDLSRTVPTQEGTLYSFRDKHPPRDRLKSSWSGSVIVDASRNNSNNVVVVVCAEDNAANSLRTSKSVSIDTSPPKVDISFDNNRVLNGKYFKSDRTATVAVCERNFDPGYVRPIILSSSGHIPQISGWERSSGSGSTDDSRWTAKLRFSRDADYDFEISCSDMAGNKSGAVSYAEGTAAGKEFTIDKTAPVVKISYDNNKAENGCYFNKKRTAVITVTERNFSPECADIRIDKLMDGARAAEPPPVSAFIPDGDSHTAQVIFAEDAMYTFHMECCDKAGNKAAVCEAEKFYIDRTAPGIEISGIKNVFSGTSRVRPELDFSDDNIVMSSINWTLTGCRAGNADYSGKYTDSGKGLKFTYDDFDRIKDVDDVYCLKAYAKDRAGNTAQKQVRFSVNRFGSCYALGDSIKMINGRYMIQAGDLSFCESNVSRLRSSELTLFKNDSAFPLIRDKDYSVEECGGKGEWFKYRYTVFSKNFADDAAYRITARSEDEAGNDSVNGADDRKSQICFAVDRTAPLLSFGNLENNRTYPEENHIIYIAAGDNLRLSSLTLYLDGVQCREWDGEELKKTVSIYGELSYTVKGDSSSAHKLKAVAVDAAGNKSELTADRFYVTKSLWVRFCTDTSFFIVINFCIAALIILILARAARGRKHRRTAL